MSASEFAAVTAVGVSVSDSPDLSRLGLSSGHLHDATARIAWQLLASGRSLAFGGDLRKHGFAELLAELVPRYRNHPRHSETIVVTDYLAWPVHIRMTPNEIAAFSAEHESCARVLFLALDGTRIAPGERLKLRTREPNDEEWTEGLTAMRTVMRRETRARIVLGGRVEGYRGAMPGIAEEVCLSLAIGQPVFLIGGFGGCARDIAETVGLARRYAGSRDEWAGRERFRDTAPGDLRNGLTSGENAILAETPHIETATALVLRGLGRVLGDCDRQRDRHAKGSR